MQPSDSDLQQGRYGGESAGPDIMMPSDQLNAEPAQVISGAATPQPAARSLVSRPALRRWIVAIVLVLLVGLTAFLIWQRQSRQTITVEAGNFNTIQIPLSQFVETGGTLPTQTLTVNGRLQTEGTLVLSPSTQPLDPTTGQLYYDQTGNNLAYFNGTEFINILGTTGDVTTTNTVINNTTLQTINNIQNTSIGNTTTLNGTVNQVAKFTGTNTLGDSIINDDGTKLTVTGSINLVSPVPPSQTQRIWPDSPTPGTVSDPDGQAQELGVKFRSSIPGAVTGMRFYKGVINTGPHVGSLWTSSGVLLAQITFTGETASGWQTMDFSTPVQILANTTYVVSYFTPVGHYATDLNYFTPGPHISGNLEALQTGVDGGNGVFILTNSPGVFPTNTFFGNNYWVDVNFVPNAVAAVQYQINGNQISTVDLENGSDIAMRSATQTFSGFNSFRAPLDSTAAFVIQQSDATPLFVANTVSGVIEVLNLTVADQFLSLDEAFFEGHIIGQSSGTPSALAGPAACTTPTVSVTGTDLAGTINVTTGTGCGALGNMIRVGFMSSYSAIPRVVLTPATAAAAGLSVYVDSTTQTNSTFILQVLAGTITDATSYRWYYHVIQ